MTTRIPTTTPVTYTGQHILDRRYIRADARFGGKQYYNYELWTPGTYRSAVEAQLRKGAFNSIECTK